MPTSLECAYYHKIMNVKLFHLKGKARLSWNMAAVEFFVKLTNNGCEENHFLVAFFPEISQKSVFSLNLQCF